MLPMTRNRRSRPQPQGPKRSPLLLLLILVFWSVTMGWGLSLLAQSSPVPDRLASRPETQLMAQVTPKALPYDGAIDAVPNNLKLAESVYLENCATCHIGVPPAFLPTETWKSILLDSNHYGITIQPLFNPFRQLVWNYLLNFSRSVFATETVPSRVGQSRFFKALHPGVTLPQTVSLKGCVSCHPGAGQYHFGTIANTLQPDALPRPDTPPSPVENVAPKG